MYIIFAIPFLFNHISNDTNHTFFFENKVPAFYVMFIIMLKYLTFLSYFLLNIWW